MVNDRIKLLEQCSLRILSAIKRYEVPDTKVHTEGIRIKAGLLQVFRAALCRVSALTWSVEIDNVIKKVHEALLKYAEELDCTPAILELFDPVRMRQDRLDYCRFRMINKYVLPLPIDCMLSHLMADDYPNVRLCELSEDIKILNLKWDKDVYQYYPYMFTPQEISFALLCGGICSGTICDPVTQEEALKRIYLSCNYPNVEEDGDRPIYELEEIKVAPIDVFDETHHAIYIGKRDNSDHKDKLCVAIGNAELKLNNFKAALDRRPNRSYQRYRNLSKMLDAAIEQKVDLLVLPENYLPIEWLPTVSRFCANNQIGLITGIEHVLFERENPLVYNLTAVILPYEHHEQKFAHVFCHSKVKFSPEERRQIEGHHCTCREGSNYQLFCWHGIWFPVYCCFELASIQDRALFRSYADMVVAVEWNTDIPYFSSIMESMCRDLHCYCIQANSSGPGDSRILQPTKSELRDIIKTKGGKNPCILAADIDINALREFQTLHYSLQKDSGIFKPTPPDFNRKVLEMKREGTLFQWIVDAHF